MFLETLCRRNPEFIQSVVRLHQKGELRANTYVLDYDAIKENLTYMSTEAGRLGLTIYPMTKQIGRNPAILDLIKDMNFGKVVVVDWMGAKQIAANGVEIGHVGHLVQIPKAEASAIARLKPEVWTVFSYEKAAEISQAFSDLDQIQHLLVRVWKDGDTFYKGHEGGVHLNDLLKTAKKIDALPNVKIVGVTSFPCLLFDEEKKKLHVTPNMDTIIESSEVLGRDGFEIKQVNAPGTTSTVALDILARKGATHVEPGHGMTGTTPLHAFSDLHEKPAILYLSEVSHIHAGHAYFYGGGLYVDPVFSNYTVRALSGRDSDSILEGRYEAVLPDPSSIDYYGMLRTDSKTVTSGDTVILCFRAQVFHTRANIAVIERNKNEVFSIKGYWDTTGRELKQYRTSDL